MLVRYFIAHDTPVIVNIKIRTRYISRRIYNISDVHAANAISQIALPDCLINSIFMSFVIDAIKIAMKFFKSDANLIFDVTVASA